MSLSPGSKILIIKEPWIDLIRHRQKTMEIRGMKCKKRGTVYLAKSRSKHIFGSVEITDCKGPMSKDEFAFEKTRHLCDETPYQKTYGWCLKNPVLFEKPIPYKHPLGAVIWVTVRDEGVEA